MACKELTEEGADNLLEQLDTAYRRVEESQGSRVKLESAEINLLKVLEQARDMLTAALMASADRAALKEIFGGSCRRTGRIRAVLDAAQFTSERVVDPRLMGCRNACESVEQVLRDLGLGAALRAAQVAEREALAKEKAMIASTRTPPKPPPGGEDAAAAAAAAAAAKVAEEADRLAREEAARKAAEAEEAARAAAVEEAAREAAKEEAARTAAAEAARRAAEEEASRKAAAEEVAAAEAARVAEEEEAARKAAEAEAARRLAEEAAAAEAARRGEEEEAARRAAAADAARKAAEEAARRDAEARAAEMAARKASEEEARKRREEEVHPKGKGGKGKGKAKGKHPGAEVCTPARPLCHAEKVPLCKIGCGRQVAPGVTRHGKPFDTCCRGCALGAGHDDLCGKINPSKVGPGKCKMGCGLDAAKGRDSSGWALDTCCRGCATGEGHDGKCGKDVGDRDVPYTTIDPGESFYRMAKLQLPVVQYNQLVQEIRELNRKSQSLEECHRKCSVLIGDGKEELLLELRRLLAASSVRLSRRSEAAIGA